MFLKSLTLKDFRNFKEVTFLPSEKLNFLIGENGQGKTSLLEAIGFLSQLKSFRSSDIESLIRIGSDDSIIRCVTQSDQPYEIRVNLFKNPKPGKLVRVDEKIYKSSLSFLKQRFQSQSYGFHAVVFQPSDHDLVRGDPAERRSYLDRALGAESPDYLEALGNYQKALKQRNALLRSTETTPLSRAHLQSFTEPLIYWGIRIEAMRLKWVERMNLRINLYREEIAPRQAEIKVVMSQNWYPSMFGLSLNNKDLRPGYFTGQVAQPSLQILEDSFRKRLLDLESAEMHSMTTLAGPQRDDWQFLLGEEKMKDVGSQGEMRTALLSLKLGEISLYREKTGMRPILLLDDFSSELDHSRREYLLSFLMKTDLQVFVSSTENTTGVGQVFKVSHGEIFS